MAQEIIKCPKCGESIKVSEALSHDVEIEIKDKLEKEFQHKLDTKSKQLEDKAKQEAQESVAVKLADLKEQIKEKDVKIKESQNQELELKKKQRELRDKEEGIAKQLEAKDQELNEKLLVQKKTVEEKVKKDVSKELKITMIDLEEQIKERDIKIKEAQDQELELKRKERQSKDKEDDLLKQLENKDQELNEKLLVQKKEIEEKAKKDANEELKVTMIDLEDQIKNKSEKLDEAHRQEIELRKQQRKLEEDKKDLELEVIRKIDLERKNIAERLTNDFEEKHRLKNLEKDKKLDDMRKKIEDLQKKAEQGSQQAQGEVLELDLEERFKDEFPIDDIIPVGKGVKGGDVIHTVKMQSGRVCGKILWEAKRTKNWSDGWIQKAKDDQRDAKAHLAVIVSETMPEGINQFNQINGVWVVCISLALELARVLRITLQEVSNEKSFQDGKTEKMEIMYAYLTGAEFKNRIEAILEGFITMRKDLITEKAAMERLWAKREKNIDKVIKNISGMHGDLEGIAGPSLPVIKMLELPVDLEDK